MTNAALNGKPYAESPHVRSEGEVTSIKPRRGVLRYKNGKVVLAAIGALALGVLVAGAEERTNYFDWEKVPGQGTTVLNAVDVFQSGNWSEGTPTAGDRLNFRQGASVEMPSALHFVTVGRAVTKEENILAFQTLGLSSSAMMDLSQPRTVLLSDYPLELTGNANMNGMMCYADCVFIEGAWLDRAIICGDLPADQRTGGNVDVYHRLDLYANNAGDRNSSVFRVDTSWNPYYVIFGPRNSKEDVAYSYVAASGKPYFLPTAGCPGIALPVGAFVSEAEGRLPADTYLKRIFPDGSIELSNPISAEGEVTLTFKARTEPTVLSIAQGWQGTYPHKFAADDDFSVHIARQWTDAKIGTFHSGYYPARVRIDAVENDRTLTLGDVELEWPVSAESVYVLKQESAGTTTKLYAPEEADYTITCFDNLVGTVVKTGAGKLTLSLGDKSAANTGKLVVSEGVLEVTAGSWVREVEVAAGATLVINGELAVEKATLASGAAVKGGVLAAELLEDGGVSCSDGGALRYVGGTLVLDETPYVADPETLSVKPAFWVDARATDSITYTEEDGTKYVTRVDDCRSQGGDDGYMFATNNVARPRLMVENLGDQPYIWMKYQQGATSWEDVEDLFWNVPLKNIKAVFIAHSHIDNGGGQLLGNSIRTINEAGAGAFKRVGGTGVTFDWGMVYAADDEARANLDRHWKCYHNGIAAHMYDGYPYGNSTVKSSEYDNPYVSMPILVTDVETSTPALADCFATHAEDIARNGGKMIHEVLVYTNEVDDVQRMQIENYLSRKWMNVDVAGNRYPRVNDKARNVSLSANVAYAPAAGETFAVDGLVGEGTFAKLGEGTVLLDNAVDDGARIEVKAGKLQVRSVMAEGAALVPEGAHLHLDAMRTDDMTLVNENELTQWRSADSSVTMSLFASGSENKPRLVQDAINGHPAVDFGVPKHTHRADGSYDPDTILSAMTFANNSRIHTIVILQNSSRSGGMVSSRNIATWGADGILRAGWSEDGGLGVDTHSSPSNPLVGASYGLTGNPAAFLGSTLNTRPYSARIALNDEPIDPTTDGYTGGNDLLTLVLPVAIGVNAFSLNQGYGSIGGGEIVGEYLIYERGLSPLAMADLSAHLKQKWFGVESDGYRRARLGTVSVGADATLEVVGGAPLAVGGLVASAGTVVGSVKTAANAVFEVPVKADGSVDTLSFNGTIDLSAGGTVVLTGDSVKNIAAGDHVLVSSASIAAGVLDGWTVANAPRNRFVTLSLRDGAFVLSVTKPGSMIFIR